MQNDLFLPEQEARLRELRVQKREHESAARSAGQEIYELIKAGTSYSIGPKSYLCLLPTGGTYFYTAEEMYSPQNRVSEFHSVDLDCLERAVKFLQSQRVQKEAHLD